MYTHYLVTRFNIRIEGMGPEKIESPPLDQAWMQARLQYFETYCAKSVCNQFTTAFTWLVYFDTETDPAIFQRLAPVLRCGPKIECITADHFDAMLADVRQRIALADQPYIITSRLDNDDMISRDFIQRVQDAFVPEHNTLINFNAGFELDATTGLVKKWNQRFHNQFISLIEKKQPADALTVYGFPHWGPPTEMREINIDVPPAWMHLRHVNNYSHNTYKAIPVFSNQSLENFPVEHAFSVRRWWHTMRYGMQWFPRMVWRRIKNSVSAK
jgi:hypothetical protein